MAIQQVENHERQNENETGEMYFNYNNLKLRYDPFPIGLAKPVLAEDTYRELVAAYPPIDLFKYIPKIGKKYSLSEKFNGNRYEEFIRSNAPWRAFHKWTKSEDFIRSLLAALRERNIELGYDKKVSTGKKLKRALKSLSKLHLPVPEERLKTRFEFSMLPADGGSVIPHTDGPGKIITLVVSMIDEGEWDPAFGGGTEINRPKDVTKTYNELNRQLDFDEVETLDCFDFTPNQAVVFIKTFNSWHSVRPMTGAGSKALRKTLTINVEAVR